jgi:hypothetical protein
LVIEFTWSVENDSLAFIDGIIDISDGCEFFSAYFFGGSFFVVVFLIILLIIFLFLLVVFIFSIVFFLLDFKFNLPLFIHGYDIL